MRPTLFIDVIATITVECACMYIYPAESLDILVRMTWIWKIFLPRAGIRLVKRLRERVDHHCERTASTEKVEWILLLSNMLFTVYGEVGRDESVVRSALGTEPFGMIEMQ